jgi:hypothetical protein
MTTTQEMTINKTVGGEEKLNFFFGGECVDTGV